MAVAHAIKPKVPESFMERVKISMSERRIRAGDHMVLVTEVKVTARDRVYEDEVFKHPYTRVNQLIEEAYREQQDVSSLWSRVQDTGRMS